MRFGDPPGVSKTDPSYTGGDLVPYSPDPIRSVYTPQVPVISTASPGSAIGWLVGIAVILLALDNKRE